MALNWVEVMVAAEARYADEVERARMKASTVAMGSVERAEVL